MYCLLEVVAMAPAQLVPQFVEHLGWLKVIYKLFGNFTRG